MARNYAETIRALRAKAVDPAVGDAESKILLEKAAELERKYGNSSSQTTNTTTTSTDEWINDFINRRHRPPPRTGPTPDEAWAEVYRLFQNQWRWNDKYYDKDGKPRPTEADTDPYYEDPDRWYGYDKWYEGEEDD